MHWSWLLANRQSSSHNTAVSDYEMQTADAQRECHHTKSTLNTQPPGKAVNSDEMQARSKH